MNDQNNNNNRPNNNPNNNPNNSQGNRPNNNRPPGKFHKGPRRGPGPGPNNNNNPNQRRPQHPQQGGPGPNNNNNNRQQQQQHQGGGNQPRHHNPQRNNQPQQNQNANSLDQLLLQYDRLVDQHIEARKKLHELYYRCDDNRLYKLEDNFFHSAQKIQKFERELRPWQLDLLKKHRTEIYPLDAVYSTAHPEAEKFDKETAPTLPAPNLFHISPVQQSRPSYKGDTEISDGSYDDYLQYKSEFK